MNARISLLLVSITCLALGCGNKDDAATAPPAGLAGVAGTGAAGAIPCGGKLCLPFNGPGLMLPVPACCADQFAQTCGVLLGSQCKKAPPPGETCASFDVRDFGLILFGCCAGNQCGLLDEFDNVCRSIESLQSEFAMEEGPAPVEFPAPAACGGAQ